MKSFFSALVFALGCLCLSNGASASTVAVSATPFGYGHCVQNRSGCFGNRTFGTPILAGGAAGARHFMIFNLSGPAGQLISAMLDFAIGKHSYKPAGSYTVSRLLANFPGLTERPGRTDADAIFNAYGFNTIGAGGREYLTPFEEYPVRPFASASAGLSGGKPGITATGGTNFAPGGSQGGGTGLFDPGSPKTGPDAATPELAINQRPVTPVPLPAGFPLFLSALGSLLFVAGARRSRRMNRL